MWISTYIYLFFIHLLIPFNCDYKIIVKNDQNFKVNSATMTLQLTIKLLFLG